MKEYLINFFVWYYFIKVKGFFTESILLHFSFLMNQTNTLPMARNLTKPLFQDESSLGKYLGMFIRFWWVGFGTLYCLILIIPRLLIGLLLLVMPFIPVVQILSFVANQI
jgi:hypothetical protein